MAVARRKFHCKFLPNRHIQLDPGLRPNLHQQHIRTDIRVFRVDLEKKGNGMTSPDQNVSNNFNGVDATGATQPWAQVRLRMRTTLSNILRLSPFTYQYSRWDQITTTAEQTSWRYIDTDGIVWDQKAWQLVQIEWFKDGAPTPVTPTKIAKYRKAADTLRPWPTNDVINGGSYTGALPGDPVQTYPSYPAGS
jgi:hypothetical protein